MTDSRITIRSGQISHLDESTGSDEEARANWTASKVRVTVGEDRGSRILRINRRLRGDSTKDYEPSW